jgi:ParB-like chromosome segregation protein Spo0J
MAKLKTPYADLLPPLSTEEQAALKADITANGIRVPIDIDEDGNILDGHHRYLIDRNAPTNVVKGLSEDERLAYAIRANVARRQLSVNQRAELDRKWRIPLAKRLIAGLTQPQVAALLGTDQSTVSRWIKPSMHSHTTFIDHRVKVPTKEYPKLLARVNAGETQAQVAADAGVSQMHVSRICEKERAKEEADRQEARNLKLVRKETADDNQNVIVGDFRDHADDIDDESVSLIFTDPPYDRKSLDLYGDLAEFGAAKLQSGGSLLCYAGHYLLADILPRMTAHLRLWWVCCCRHTGKSARMTEYGIVVGWKPILWFVKETRGDKDTFVDDIVVSEMEKGTHAWQQGLVDAEYYIEKLSRPGDLVVDPFCGGGTTAVAAKRLDRRWRTFEIKETAAVKARKRIKDDGATDSR